MRCPGCHGTGKLEGATIGERVQRLRRAAGLTQKAVVAGAGVAKNTLDGIESRGTRPHKATLARLAAYFHVDISELKGV